MLPSSFVREVRNDGSGNSPQTRSLNVRAAAAGLLGAPIQPLNTAAVGVSNAALIDSILAQEQRRRALLLAASPTMSGLTATETLLEQERALSGSLIGAGAVTTLDRLGAGLTGLGTMLPGGLASSSAAARLAATSRPFLLDRAPAPAVLAASVPPAPLAQQVSASLPVPEAGQLLLDALEQNGRKGRTGTFPQKLHQMLSDLEKEEGGTAIASYLPHGRAFAIHKPNEFVKTIMPKYFRMSRFSSFQRQLNLYEFMRITDGQDKGAYFHELFIRGRPVLASQIRRNKIKGASNAATKPTRLSLSPSGRAVYGNHLAGAAPMGEQLSGAASLPRGAVAAAAGSQTAAELVLQAVLGRHAQQP